MRAALGAAVAFLATAGLVSAGVFHGADQYAVEHWMPYVELRHHRLVTLSSLVFPPTYGPAGKLLLNLWVYPGAFVPSAAIVTWLAWRARSLGWCLLWVAGNVVELAGKLVVSRPALFRHAVHVTPFDHSLPSGHTIRSFLVAAAVAWSWRHGRAAYLWALSVPVALVVLGYHAPLDCVAGAFVAAGLIALGPQARNWLAGFRAGAGLS